MRNYIEETKAKALMDTRQVYLQLHHLRSSLPSHVISRKEAEERQNKIAQLQADIEEFNDGMDKVSQFALQRWWPKLFFQLSKEKEDKELEITKAREESNQIEQKEAELKRDYGKLQQITKNLRLQKQDGTRLFGPKVPEVLQAIEKEKRWKIKPLGPIG